MTEVPRIALNGIAEATTVIATSSVLPRNASASDFSITLRSLRHTRLARAAKFGWAQRLLGWQACAVLFCFSVCFCFASALLDAYVPRTSRLIPAPMVEPPPEAGRAVLLPALITVESAQTFESA